MVTKADSDSRYFHHVSKRNGDGTPLRVKRTGKVKVWATRPDHFKVPVKYGLYESGYIGLYLDGSTLVDNRASWLPGCGVFPPSCVVFQAG